MSTKKTTQKQTQVQSQQFISIQVKSTSNQPIIISDINQVM